MSWNVADRLAELLALVDIGHDDVDRRLHDAERPGREHRALVVEPAHQHVDALAERADEVLLGHFAILEDQLRSVGAAHAELVELGSRTEALEALFDQESADAARTGRRIGLGVDDQRVGDRPVGDPHFRAIEHVAVALALGAGRHRDDVGTGAGLGHRERADMLAGDQLGQIARLLLRRCRCARSG